VLEVNRANVVDNIVKLAEYYKVEEERKWRIPEFQLRAKSMGITEERFVVQKVAIWEGMWAAKQNGDDIEVSTLFFAPI